MSLSQAPGQPLGSADSTVADSLAGTPPMRRVAIVGAGPVGLTLALLLASRTHHTEVCVFDARPLDRDVSADARTLALSLGSVQLLQRLAAWDAARAAPIRVVHVSQQPPTAGQASVTMTAEDLGCSMLGAVAPYGSIVAPLQRAWLHRVAQTPARFSARFGTPVAAIKALGHDRVEVDAGVAEVFDLAVVAEGGVFADQTRRAVAHDYRQTAWVGSVQLSDDAPQGVAFERFTRHGPVALLPLPPREGLVRAALVWCVPSDDDPVHDLDDAQRIAVLNSVFAREAGRIVALEAPLKAFALGLNAQRTLVDAGASIVRIGNAAQTLHPVAGQGLNLGLRDAHALCDALRDAPTVAQALRRVEWQRAPDRWALIAGTDFLARSFTWGWPGFGAARGAALAVLDRVTPAKRWLARQFMHGSR